MTPFSLNQRNHKLLHAYLGTILHPVYEMFRHHCRRTVIGILKIDINIIKMLQHDWITDLQTRNFKLLKNFSNLKLHWLTVITQQ